MQRGLGRVEPDELRLARLGLAAAMAVAAALLLWAGRGTTFFSDEIQYYARSYDSGVPVDFGITWFFQPFNGHLALLGKLMYELLFAVFGTDYFWFRVVEVVAYLACVALFFELARVRIGAWAAVALSVVLLFLGSGWEVMLWPFDMHTLLALGAGLGALLALERGGRRADVIAFALLLTSIASLEIGFAFAVGIGVGILMRPDRWSRIWIVAVPLVLYAVWSVWAKRYGGTQIDPVYFSGLATSLSASLAASVAALTGLVDPGTIPGLAGGLGPDRVLAVVAVIAFIWRISVARVPPTTWVFVTTLVTYWVFITLAHRQPDTTRYMLVDGLLLLLIAADLIGPVRVSGRWLAVLCVLVALALPLNMVKLFDGRDELTRDAGRTGADYAMLELLRDQVDPAYRPVSARVVIAARAGPQFGLPADTYFLAADRVGSLATPLAELRDATEDARVSADLTLVGALEPRLKPAPAPSSTAGCRPVTGSESAPADTVLPTGGALIHASEPVSLSLGRFAPPERGAPLDWPKAGQWAELAIPTDPAPDPWHLAVAGDVEICPLGGGK